ncbi:MAG TPA: DinB family protein [Gemmatimonadaceae bacterium]|nr:DinB family protein [Gemmatimonadaceae bacterium]
MRRLLVVLLFPALAAPAAAQQGAAPAASAVGSVRPVYETVKGFITRAAAQVPEADYAFRATADVRSFGQLVGHVANANYMLCALALGEPSPSRENIEQARTTKTALIEALGASFSYCDRAYQVSDAAALQPATVFGQNTTRLYALAINAAHDWEHYGNMVTYMRLKGMVPPSTQP